MNTNEDLRARRAQKLKSLRVALGNARLLTGEEIAAFDYAIAALARQEEGREAVATVVGFDSWSRIAVDWHTLDIPPDTKLYTHPAPHSGGEGDAEVARLRQALQDVADPIGYLRREAEAKGERLGGMAYSIANDLHFVKQIASRALATPTPQAAGDGMLPAALIPHAKEWYRLCERRFAVERIKISGALAEAIVEAIGTTAGQQAAGVSDADIHLAAQMLSWGRDEGLTAAQERDIDAHQQKLFAALTAAGAAPEECIRVSRVLAETAAIVAAEWLDLFAETPGLEKYERYTYGPQVEVLRDDLKAALAATPNPGAQHGQEGREVMRDDAAFNGRIGRLSLPTDEGAAHD